MVPELALHVTAELLVLLTVAVNCCFEPEPKTKVLGEILSCVCADWPGVPLLDIPPQPTEIRAARSIGTVAKPLA
jgi:hypothetical protein